MKFNNLEDRMLYYRSLTDYKLIPNSYVIIMLDGRAFSHSIKKIFKKPFDDDFINIMNETAIYLCNKIQGCKFAYVQSDEISLVITDFDTLETASFFNYRLEKIISICASLATSKFNQLFMIYSILHNNDISKENIFNIISKTKLFEFDCKAWNVPNFNDVYAWFLYRQNDCIKNSKNQTAQAYLSHNFLVSLTSDQQIELLKKEKGIDWEAINNDKKYGRFIYKEPVKMVSEKYGEFIRNKFITHDGYLLNNESNKNKFIIEIFHPISSDILENKND